VRPSTGSGELHFDQAAEAETLEHSKNAFSVFDRRLDEHVRSSVGRASTWNARAWAPVIRNFVCSERSAFKNSRQSRWIVVIAKVETPQIFHGVEALSCRGSLCVLPVNLVGFVQASHPQNVLDEDHEESLARQPVAWL
jgi:hypothetical protein